MKIIHSATPLEDAMIRVIRDSRFKAIMTSSPFMPGINSAH